MGCVMILPPPNAALNAHGAWLPTSPKCWSPPDNKAAILIISPWPGSISNSPLEQNDVAPATFIKLAEIYERLRRPEEAAGLVDRALRADSACAPALLLRARLDRQAGRLDAAERLLRAFPANAEQTLRVGAAYELGGILDRQGRYDEAMTAFLAAKSMLQLQAERPAAELKIMRARINHLTANASADVLKSWFEASVQLQPIHRLALLGGHPRSGTTLLEQILDAHPDMISAEETEIFKHDAYVPLMRGQPDDTAMYSALATATPGALQHARHNYFHAMELSLGQPVAGRHCSLIKIPPILF